VNGKQYLSFSWTSLIVTVTEGGVTNIDLNQKKIKFAPIDLLGNNSHGLIYLSV